MVDNAQLLKVIQDGLIDHYCKTTPMIKKTPTMRKANQEVDTCEGTLIILCQIIRIFCFVAFFPLFWKLR